MKEDRQPEEKQGKDESKQKCYGRRRENRQKIQDQRQVMEERPKNIIARNGVFGKWFCQYNKWLSLEYSQKQSDDSVLLEIKIRRLLEMEAQTHHKSFDC